MLPTFSRRRVAATALAVLAIGGMALAGRAVAVPSGAAVTIKDFDFHPMAVTIPVGATVTWTNLDGEPHTVTSIDGAFRSQALDQNDAYSFRFTKPGTYKYLCTIHPRMVATVTVK
jgi:plastocyanin